MLLIDKKKAEEIAKASKENSWNISNIESKPTSSSAPPPFTKHSSTMLQEDLVIHQKELWLLHNRVLTYEQGFITYMRTDSTHLSTEALVLLQKILLKINLAKNFYLNQLMYIKQKWQTHKKHTKRLGLQDVISNKQMKCQG